MDDMGINLRQSVSDGVYSEFIEGIRDVFVVQSNDYFTGKLKDKKYLWLVNEEYPEKPEIRFRMESVIEEYGNIQEDVYGQQVTGPHLKIKLKKRTKTK